MPSLAFRKRVRSVLQPGKTLVLEPVFIRTSYIHVLALGIFARATMVLDMSQ